MSDTSTNLGEVTYTRVYDAPRDLVFRVHDRSRSTSRTSGARSA